MLKGEINMNNMEQTEKKHTVAEMNELNGLMLNENSRVFVSSIKLQEIEKTGAKAFVLKGIGMNNKPVSIPVNERSMKYLYEKSSKGIGKAFTLNGLKEYFNSEIGTVIKPKFEFFTHVLREQETKIGYGITFKKLMPISAEMLNKYLLGASFKEVSTVKAKTYPFNLGSIKVQNKAGLYYEINFGKLNGNSGISVSGNKFKLTGKHLPNSVEGVLRTLKEQMNTEYNVNTEALLNGINTMY